MASRDISISLFVFLSLLPISEPFFLCSEFVSRLVLTNKILGVGGKLCYILTTPHPEANEFIPYMQISFVIIFLNIILQ
jgi:hypothetical protein